MRHFLSGLLILVSSSLSLLISIFPWYRRKKESKEKDGRLARAIDKIVLASSFPFPLRGRVGVAFSNALFLSLSWLRMTVGVVDG